MVNVTSGRVWTLDTAVGIVTRDPLNIYGILVTWKVASAGAIVLAEVNEPGEGAVGDTILDAVSLGASSAAGDQMSQWFPIEGWFQGLRKVTMTDISKIAIYVR